MAIELITGHAGSAHVSSADAGWLNAGTFGSGKYVLDTLNKLACNVQSANLVTIGTGDAVFEGRHVHVSSAESVAIDNGAQGVNRNDIVCIKYEYDSGTSEETASMAVVKGTAVSGTPSDPTIPSGSILSGSTTAYMPLWRIPIEGITVGTPVALYGNVIVTLNGLLSKVWTASQIPNISATKITSGTLDAARIPNLDASKITTGTLAAARIPGLDASKLTSGTIADGRLPTKGSAGTAGTSSATSGATLAVPYITTDAYGRVTAKGTHTHTIGSLNTSAITAGTLGVARGGTGKTSGTCYMADTLYNSTATTDGVTLSASAANYTMMEIYFRDNDSHYNSTKVFSPNGKTVNLCMFSNTTNGQNNYKRREISISGTSITNQSYGEQDGTATATSTNNIYIYAVVGYK